MLVLQEVDKFLTYLNTIRSFIWIITSLTADHLSISMQTCGHHRDFLHDTVVSEDLAVSSSWEVMLLLSVSPLIQSSDCTSGSVSITSCGHSSFFFFFLKSFPISWVDCYKEISICPCLPIPCLVSPPISIKWIHHLSQVIHFWKCHSFRNQSLHFQLLSSVINVDSIKIQCCCSS
jgi:hypothetical protein